MEKKCFRFQSAIDGGWMDGLVRAGQEGKAVQTSMHVVLDSRLVWLGKLGEELRLKFVRENGGV